MTPSRGCKRVAAGLRDDGWSVTLADDGHRLAGLLSGTWTANGRGEGPDLIVADAALTGLAGGAARACLAADATPLVLIVDSERKDAAEAAHELGAAVVLEKPADPEAVREAAAALRPQSPGRD